MKKWLQRFNRLVDFALQHRNRSLFCLTVIIAPNLGSFVGKNNVDVSQIVSFCFVMAAIFLVIGKEHGEIFPKIGFKLIFAAILLVISFGILGASFKNIQTEESFAALTGSIMGLGSLFAMFGSLILISWSIGEVFLESAKRMIDDN